MDLQSDGKIIIGGYFTSEEINKNNLIRLDSSGTWDPSFTPSTYFTRSVYDLKVLENDEILVGSYFQQINGVTYPSLAKLSKDGQINNNFDASHLSDMKDVRSIELQNDNKILIAGDGRIRRLETDGTLDPTFNTSNLNYFEPTKIEVGNNDGFFVGGYNPYRDNGIGIAPKFTPVYQFRENGQEERNPFKASWVGEVTPRITDIIYVNDSTLFVSGEFNEIEGETREGIARINLLDHSVACFDTPIKVSKFPDYHRPEIQLVSNSNESVFCFGNFSLEDSNLHHGGVKINYLANCEAEEQITRSDEQTNNTLLKVWPNPAKSVLKVHLPSMSSDPIAVKVFDLNGQILLNSHVGDTANDFEIPIDRLKSGFYILNVQTREKYFLSKFIKN